MKLNFRWQKFSLRVHKALNNWCYSVNACLQYVQNEKCVTVQYNDNWNYKCNYRWPPKLDDLSYKNVPVYIYTKWERSNSKFWLIFFKELTPNSPSPSINKWNDKNL